MTTNDHTPPEWLAEGAPVVLWNSNRISHDSPDAVVTTVKKVSKTSFSVEGEDTRIYFVGLRSTERGGKWGRYHRLADTPGSPQAQRALARTTYAELKTTASRAMDAWRKDDNIDTLTAALVAVTALARHEGIGQDGYV